MAPCASIALIPRYPDDADVADGHCPCPKLTRALMMRRPASPLPTLPWQADAGAHILQLFEAMGDFITPPSFEVHAGPRMASIAKELKKVSAYTRIHAHADPSLDKLTPMPTHVDSSPSLLTTCLLSSPCLHDRLSHCEQRHPDVPLMVFPRGAAYALPSLGACDFDVLTLDNTADISTVRTELPPKCLQGAFDPKLLVRENGSDEAKVAAAVDEMLKALGPQKVGSTYMGGAQTMRLADAPLPQGRVCKR